MTRDAEDTDTGRPATVLLVEDDAALRGLLAASLEMAGLRILEAGNRNEALACLEALTTAGPAIVLLDLGLPPHPHDTREGIATLNAVDTACLPVKVIVLTGQDQEGAALEAIHAGAFDFLAKPADPAAILQAIRRAELFLRKEAELQQHGIARVQLTAELSSGLKAAREEAEERLVRQVLKQTNFNVVQSARRLGVKRESIYYFLKKFGIRRGD